MLAPVLGQGAPRLAPRAPRWPPACSPLPRPVGRGVRGRVSVFIGACAQRPCSEALVAITPDHVWGKKPGKKTKPQAEAGAGGDGAGEEEEEEKAS